MKKLSWGCYGENDDVMVSSGVRWPLMREKKAIGVMVVSVGFYVLFMVDVRCGISWLWKGSRWWQWGKLRESTKIGVFWPKSMEGQGFVFVFGFCKKSWLWNLTWGSVVDVFCFFSYFLMFVLDSVRKSILCVCVIFVLTNSPQLSLSFMCGTITYL
jgi:hypothetical protein